MQRLHHIQVFKSENLSLDLDCTFQHCWTPPTSNLNTPGGIKAN